MKSIDKSDLTLEMPFKHESGIQFSLQHWYFIGVSIINPVNAVDRNVYRTKSTMRRYENANKVEVIGEND